jgi:HSP20 family protein
MSTTGTEIRKKQEVRDVQGAERTRSGRVYLPLTDIVETRDDIWIYADMPGVDGRALEVEIENNVLTLQGFVDADGAAALEPVHREYGIGDYWRSFTLGDSIDRSRIEASIRDGVLKLRLPKAEPAKARKIEIQAG